MQATKRWILFLAALLLVVPSCTNDGLDDGDAADVVLEIVSMDNPPVTGQTGTTGCTFEVVQWTAMMANQPKNALAGPSSVPFNDIIVDSLVISYDWIDCATCNTLDRFVGLGSVAIPAGGTNSVTFEPIAFDDLLNALPDVEGSTANLTLTFSARTTEGTAISARTFRQLFVETCD